MLNQLIQCDHRLFHYINGTLSNSFFDWFMPVITNQNNWILPLLVLIYWLLFRGDKRGRITFVILIVTVIFIDAVAAQIIKPFIGRIRPSHAMPEMINLLVPRGGQFSFVSNHAANAFGLSVILGYFYPNWKWKVTALAFIIAFSRVYVGVHYPADIFFGALFGYGSAWMILSCWVIIKMKELKKGRDWVWYET